MERVVPDHNASTVALLDGQPALVPAADVSFRLDDDPEFLARVAGEADDERVVIGTAAAAPGILRYVIVPVHAPGDPSTGQYVSAYNLSAELDELSDAFAAYAIVAAVSLVVIGGVGWAVAGRSLRPIRRLRETAARISASDLSERIPVQGNDDVSELARTVDGMLDRLEDSFSAQRRLLDDVSHELRTPLTIVRGHLELLDPDSPDDVREVRELALDELDRLGDLVAGIGTLVKSRRPDFVARADVDVAELTAQVAAKAAAFDSDRLWRIGGTAGLRARLDPARITQAWLQLAENAARYATPATEVVLGSRVVRTPTGEQLEFVVADEGPGIPTAHRERVFERFARVAPGRGDDGSGLGLSIVRAIAEAHGGTASLRDSAAGGSEFVVRVPLDRPEAGIGSAPTAPRSLPAAARPGAAEDADAEVGSSAASVHGLDADPAAEPGFDELIGASSRPAPRERPQRADRNPRPPGRPEGGTR
ncbi:sensor histidine kinase [Agromyces seonyuensis]|nr:ATP-binding protein [Agromyces seonyuensis]